MIKPLNKLRDLKKQFNILREYVIMKKELKNIERGEDKKKNMTDDIFYNI